MIEAKEAVWPNDLISDVDIGHSVDVMFGKSQRYHQRTKLIGDRNLCQIQHVNRGYDRKEVSHSREASGHVDQVYTFRQVQAKVGLDKRL